ncbi:MAG: hypothetical protein V3R93_00915, partial [Candidatus Hydrothermarchaeaceae archaeon]
MEPKNKKAGGNPYSFFASAALAFAASAAALAASSATFCSAFRSLGPSYFSFSVRPLMVSWYFV